ncbi:hypothetical protein NH8B_0877 [Pseudogulbenkiania sp. NH8B]|nr:hypothetical protein NH8B_0877 [Pseudogulbenkiania sp. NH8B]
MPPPRPSKNAEAFNQNFQVVRQAFELDRIVVRAFRHLGHAAGVLMEMTRNAACSVGKNGEARIDRGELQFSARPWQDHAAAEQTIISIANEVPPPAGAAPDAPCA